MPQGIYFISIIENTVMVVLYRIEIEINMEDV